MGLKRLILVFGFLLSFSGLTAGESYRVGVLVFDGVLTSEVTGPIEVFSKASAKGDAKFEVLTIGRTDQPVRSEEGLVMLPDVTIKNSPELDILIVPSALDMQPLLSDPELLQFVKEKGSSVGNLASHCAGAFLLGKAGLLDGRRATTYIGGEEELRSLAPKAQVQENQHVVVDGNLITSIGGLVSYDASLTLLESLAGEKTARAVAESLYYFHWQPERDGS